MIESKNSNERIISAAPAQSSLLLSNDQPPVNTSLPIAINDIVYNSREASIKNLTKRLRKINNICDPINDYLKFQKCMSNNDKILVDLNQWVALLYTLKSYVKDDIDQDYMDIIEQPAHLKQCMIKTYDNLDSVSNAFTESVKEIILTLKTPSPTPVPVLAMPSNSADTTQVLPTTRVVQPVSAPINESILEAMTSEIIDTRLPF